MRGDSCTCRLISFTETAISCVADATDCTLADASSETVATVAESDRVVSAVLVRVPPARSRSDDAPDIDVTNGCLECVGELAHFDAALRHQRLRGPAFILDAPQLIGALHAVAEFNSERAMLPISSRRSVSSTTISKSPVENARAPPKIGSRSKQIGEHQKRNSAHFNGRGTGLSVAFRLRQAKQRTNVSPWRVDAKRRTVLRGKRAHMGTPTFGGAVVL
jgi:hypothetical protein